MWKIQNHVRYYRERNSLTQEWLAEVSRVHKVTISNIETNKIVRPHPSTRQKLAKAMNIKVCQLFTPVRVSPTR